jgi:hypothetical protein
VRTILQIAKEAAERDATAPAPASLFGSDTRIAKILRQAASDTMREYLRKCDWVGLSEFQSTWVFTLTPGRFAYPLPPDYLRLIPNTEHRGGWPLGLIGPATPQFWAAWIYGQCTPQIQAGWRIRNNAIWFDPTPSANELVFIEYISRFPVVSGLVDGDYDMTGDIPVCNAPFVPRDGQLVLAVPDELPPVQDFPGDYDTQPGWDEAQFDEEISDVLKTINPNSGIEPLPQVRREAFTADTDTPAFEDDHLLSLGMTYRLRRALGLDYAEIVAEYEEEMEVKASQDAGGAVPFRIGRGGREDALVPLGGDRWLVS